MIFKARVDGPSPTVTWANDPQNQIWPGQGSNQQHAEQDCYHCSTLAGYDDQILIELIN